MKAVEKDGKLGMVNSRVTRAQAGRNPAAGAPSRHPAGAPHDGQTPRQTDDRRPAVLLIEDDRAIRGLVETVLDAEDVRLVAAENGQEALRLVHELSPSLILLDMRMPLMNGWEFVQAYRRTPAPHARIVVMTAGADPEKKAREVGVDEVLPKPFDIDQLVDLVKRLLR